MRLARALSNPVSRALDFGVIWWEQLLPDGQRRAEARERSRLGAVHLKLNVPDIVQVGRHGRVFFAVRRLVHLEGLLEEKHGLFKLPCADHRRRQVAKRGAGVRMAITVHRPGQVKCTRVQLERSRWIIVLDSHRQVPQPLGQAGHIRRALRGVDGALQVPDPLGLLASLEQCRPQITERARHIRVVRGLVALADHQRPAVVVYRRVVPAQCGQSKPEEGERRGDHRVLFTQLGLLHAEHLLVHVGGLGVVARLLCQIGPLG
mmetsp:Transcript_82063/g.232368  ORF Transcript_82063/g.232368 Transcript_82063/m.232368 type:complete len:262 (-) Transcript_82063:1622-2407(-)